MLLEISQNSQENACARVSFLTNFIKKETLARVFSCEFYEISKNTFSYRTPPAAAIVDLENKQGKNCYRGSFNSSEPENGYKQD